MMRKMVLIMVATFVLLIPHNAGYAAEYSCNCKPNQNMNAVLWYQQSAEAKALYLQGFQLAKLRLNEALQKPSKKNKAIILDVDETVLNNSPFMAHLIKSGLSFEEGWEEWVNQAKAKPLPGALEFLEYADYKGVSIYYVTNRDKNMSEATLKNLKSEGFPQVTREHVWLKDSESSKESRRIAIEKKYDVVLYMGDNLIDFSKEFDGGVQANRKKQVEKLKNEFGDRFIIFPNPMYGDWEKDLPKGKDSCKGRKALLQSYK